LRQPSLRFSSASLSSSRFKAGAPLERRDARH
jgi:hypothetical protein